VEKYYRSGQATDGIVVHVHCMLDNLGYKYTPSCCVILLALPLKQWLHVRTSMLRYTHSACLVLSLALYW